MKGRKIKKEETMIGFGGLKWKNSSKKCKVGQKMSMKYSQESIIGTSECPIFLFERQQIENESNVKRK